MGVSEEKKRKIIKREETHITDHCCINQITFWSVLGLSHHNASPGDGNKWVIVPCWSYGGPIYITSKSTLDNVGKHCADHCYHIYRETSLKFTKKKKKKRCIQFPLQLISSSSDVLYRVLVLMWSLPDADLQNSLPRA